MQCYGQRLATNKFGSILLVFRMPSRSNFLIMFLKDESILAMNKVPGKIIHGMIIYCLINLCQTRKIAKCKHLRFFFHRLLSYPAIQVLQILKFIYNVY